MPSFIENAAQHLGTDFAHYLKNKRRGGDNSSAGVRYSA
jgi:hypothetical protein